MYSYSGGTGRKSQHHHSVCLFAYVGQERAIGSAKHTFAILHNQ
jgi:hypothetical protein